MELVNVYANPAIAWQLRVANELRKGLEANKLRVQVRSKCPPQLSTLEHHIVLGPNLWVRVQQQCKERGINYLMVNRAFWGDPHNVAIGWNGMNGHADFLNEQMNAERYWSTCLVHPRPLKPIDPDGHALILGQYNLHTHAYPSLDAWQQAAEREVNAVYPRMRVKVRPHPAVSAGGPLWGALAGVTLAVTLNSTAVVECLLAGVQCVAQDDGNVARCWVADRVHQTRTPMLDSDRMRLLGQLAWAQWAIAELGTGQFWKHLTWRRPNKPPQPGFPCQS